MKFLEVRYTKEGDSPVVIKLLFVYPLCLYNEINK